MTQVREQAETQAAVPAEVMPRAAMPVGAEINGAGAANGAGGPAALPGSRVVASPMGVFARPQASRGWKSMSSSAPDKSVAHPVSGNSVHADNNLVSKNVREFWTSRQRQGHSLHEISYRACFKPQLPEYFISRFTEPGDLVADPFLGRGTTPLQAHLMGRRAAGSDINPLCVMLARPRFAPPLLDAAKERLCKVLALASDFAVDTSPPESDETSGASPTQDDLLHFYHPETLSCLLALRYWFINREQQGSFDGADDWLRMVCLNRLSGHSPGFFSVRTMPPNQAVSAESQRRINESNGLKPEPKDVVGIVMKKSRSLLRSGFSGPHQLPLEESLPPPMLRTTSASNLSYLDDFSTDLIVTSPPFLNIVDYRKDNWLRCWFAGINADELKISGYSSVADWRSFIRDAFVEMCRVVRDGGHIAFEVGEVRNGEVQLEDEVLLAVESLPLELDSVLINQQEFTKTSNLWGVRNNKSGTNTNRIVLFRRAD